MSEPHDDWSVDEPPRDFAERVMARLGEDAHVAPVPVPPRRRGRLRWIAGGVALAAGVALAVAWRGGNVASRGDAVAQGRTQIALGSRAVAVLERGAHVAWNGDDVEQTVGDVFYRVEPGGAYRVHTRAGDVQVLGTCFRVRVVDGEGSEGEMDKRDVRAGVVGAAMAAAAIVTVYEGKVAVSHAKESVTLTAGETARTDVNGVRRAAADGTPEDPLVAANENLADQVRDYQRQLGAIEAQKGAAEKQLADAQRKLAMASSDGAVARTKSEYDLSPDDWKELAKNGTVKARYACGDPDSWAPSGETLASLGLPPEDTGPVREAYQQSGARLWAVVRPLCIEALQGNAKMADELGPGTCEGLVTKLARQNEDTTEETRLAAEVRAGLVPMPTDPKALGNYGAMLYAMSGETKAIEQQLAQTLGPDDARRLLYGDESNLCSSSWSVGPRKGTAAGAPVTTGTTGPAR
jgi:hypothetical protein